MKGGIVVVVGVLEGVGVASGIDVVLIAIVVDEVFDDAAADANAEFLDGESIGWTVATGGRIGGGRGRAKEDAERRAEDGANKTGSILRTCSRSSRGETDVDADANADGTLLEACRRGDEVGVLVMSFFLRDGG